KAKKPKHSGTESIPKPLAYLDVAAQQFQKSRGTVWKYLHIYQRLIQAYPRDFAALQMHEHPILQTVEDLSTLAGLKDDIPDLIRRMVGAGEDRGVTRTLQEARQWPDAKKAQASHTSSSSSAV